MSLKLCTNLSVLLAISGLLMSGCEGLFRVHKGALAPTETSGGATTNDKTGLTTKLQLSGYPTGASRFGFLDVAAGGSGFTSYRYKVGKAAEIDCTSADGYSDELPVATKIADVIAAIADGDIKLCAIGKQDGVWQSLADATVVSWTKNMTPAVTATYSEASEWMDYTTAGEHGGESRMVLTGLRSCSGLAMQDALGVFEWWCDASEGEAIFYSRLGEGKGLLELVTHGSPNGAWKDNSVTISGHPLGTVSSAPAKWWSNVIEPLADSSAATLTIGAAHAGKIFTINASANSLGVVISADRIAIVTLNNATITSTVAANNCSSATTRCLVDATGRSGIWLEGGTWDGVSGPTTMYVMLASSQTNAHVARMRLTRGGYGLYAAGGESIRMSQISVQSMLLDGIDVMVSALGTRRCKIDNVVSANNSQRGMRFSNCASGYLSKLTAYNNLWEGIYLTAAQNIPVSELFVLNNSIEGIVFMNGSYISATNLVAFNSGNGIRIRNTHYSNFNHLLTVNNSSYGVYFTHNSLNNFLAQVVATHHGTEGINVAAGSNNQTFLGTLVLGNNTTNNCNVASTGNNIATGGAGATCGYAGEASVTTTLSTSFVGKLAAGTDTINTHGGSATTNANVITDWLNFGNRYRGWGLDGGAFPAASNRAQCAGATACRIWDFAAVAGDTKILNRSGDGASANQTFVANATCPTEVRGDRFVTGYNGKKFLKNAAEIIVGSKKSTSSGNFDGLCEADETCLYLPNFGAYQGHGSLATCTFDSGGGLSGITMYGYVSNTGL